MNLIKSPPSHSLLPQLETAFTAAAAHCVRTQDERGAWQILPDARIFETALVAHALADAGGVEREVEEARRLVRRMTPQQHHPVAFAVESGLRSLLLGSDEEINLTHESFKDDVYSSRARLMQVLGLHAGRTVRSHITETQLREGVAKAWAASGASELKQWSRVELASIHILLEVRRGNVFAVEEAARVLVELQAPDGSFFANPVSSSMALIALSVARSGRGAWRKCRQYLLDTRQADGSWRFCASDVWDTTLMVRAYKNAPEFRRRSLNAAARFLREVQNADGGWAFLSGLESDSDTTSSAMLALAGVEGCDQAIDRALRYLAERQTDEGLWRTWHFKGDPPAEDAVAHIVAALACYPGRHSIRVDSAIRWLAAAYVRNGWEAGWYRGRPYSVLEIGRALPVSSPTRRAAVTALLGTQNEDGGFGHAPFEPSFAGPTGLALAAALEVFPVNDPRLARALTFLCARRQADGTWLGQPEMFGPRPLLSHFQTHTQAFVGMGLSSAIEQLQAQRLASLTSTAQPQPVSGSRS